MSMTYTPILKWKAGEQGAIKDLNDVIKKQIYPVCIVPPIPWDFDQNCNKKTIDEHLIGFGKKLKKSWNIDSTIMLDGEKLDNIKMKNKEHTMERLIDDAENNGVKIVPVIGGDKSTEYIKAVNSKIASYKRGVAIRLKYQDLINSKILVKLMTEVNVDINKVDLIIDCGEINKDSLGQCETDVLKFIDLLTEFGEFRKIILSSSSFPKSLAGIPKYSLKEYLRNDFKLWKKVVNKNSTDREISFGDYGVDDPEWPEKINPKFLTNIMMGYIRYTGKDRWYVAKGEKLYHNAVGFKQFNKLAQMIMDSELGIYCGELYSSGDNQIYNVANKIGTNGNNGTWVKAAVNHHITFVVNQLMKE